MSDLILCWINPTVWWSYSFKGTQLVIDAWHQMIVVCLNALQDRAIILLLSGKVKAMKKMSNGLIANVYKPCFIWRQAKQKSPKIQKSKL